MVHQAINPQDLRTHLRNRVVKFMFVKNDGSLREAMGTTNLSLIPAKGQPTSGRPAPDSVVTFWDMLKGEWRAVSTRSQCFLVQ